MSEDNCILIVRHLPADLSQQEKTDLLKHFGAERVRCFGDKGRMKHVAFATFCDADAAKNALKRLHQLDVLGSRLSVEFSSSQMTKYHPSGQDAGKTPVNVNNEIPSDKSAINKELELKLHEKKKKVVEEINSISSEWGLEYTYNSRLQYMYPAPTVSILTNIASALASVPKFYVQVLHLMNKMSIPPPFGPVMPTPPIPETIAPHLHQGAPPLPSEPPSEKPPEPVEDMDLSGTESELSSEGDAEDRVRTSVKRPHRDPTRPRKKAKLQIIPAPVVRAEGIPHSVTSRHEVFEQPEITAPKRIEFKLPSSIVDPLEDSIPTAGIASSKILVIPVPADTRIEAPVSLPCEPISHLPPVVQPGDRESDQEILAPATPLAPPQDLLSLVEQQPVLVEGGFGKIEPVPVPEQPQGSEGEEEEEWGAADFISSRRLRKGRLSASERKEINVFKNYSSGEPTTRLYIKNLAKQTTEKDLHYVFGRYVNWEDDTEKLMFDIRLMKEGRMKGQAFITLPREKDAEDALKDTNTFVLHDKPMVVQFARSAKPKEKQDSDKHDKTS